MTYRPFQDPVDHFAPGAREKIAALRERQATTAVLFGLFSDGDGFPRSVLEFPVQVLQSATRLARAFKRRGLGDPRDTIWDFDPERPAFVRLWGEVVIGETPHVELVAFVGASLWAYPLLMEKGRFDEEYVLD